MFIKKSSQGHKYKGVCVCVSYFHFFIKQPKNDFTTVNIDICIFRIFGHNFDHQGAIPGSNTISTYSTTVFRI